MFAFLFIHQCPQGGGDPLGCPVSQDQASSGKKTQIQLGLVSLFHVLRWNSSIPSKTPLFNIFLTFLKIWLAGPLGSLQIEKNHWFGRMDACMPNQSALPCMQKKRAVVMTMLFDVGGEASKKHNGDSSGKIEAVSYIQKQSRTQPSTYPTKKKQP